MTSPTNLVAPASLAAEAAGAGKALAASIVARCDAVVKAGGLSARTVSRLVFLDSERLDQLRGGESYLKPPTVAGVLHRLAHEEARFNITHTEGHG